MTYVSNTDLPDLRLKTPWKVPNWKKALERLIDTPEGNADAYINTEDNEQWEYSPFRNCTQVKHPNNYIQGKILARLEKLTAIRSQWISHLHQHASIKTDTHTDSDEYQPKCCIEAQSLRRYAQVGRMSHWGIFHAWHFHTNMYQMSFLGNTSSTPARDAWLIERPGLTAMKGQDASQPHIWCVVLRQ